MCKATQKIYKITNSSTNYFILTPSFLSYRLFTEWMTHLIRSGVSLNCPTFKYCKRYRHGITFEKVDKIEEGCDSSDVFEAMANIADSIELDEGLIPWKESEDTYVPPPASVPFFINPRTPFYNTEIGLPIVPSDMVLYSEDGYIIELVSRYDGINYEAREEQKYQDRLSMIHLCHSVEAAMENLFNEIHDAPDDSENELGDDSDNEPDEPEEPVIHHVGNCNICFNEEANLFKTPDCNCVGENDFSFLCSDCLDNLSKCPQCRKNY